MKPIGSSFKIIFLDEADALTSDAQNALRRLMEMYSEVTRFILSCNYSSNIISPIQSRAVVFRFKSLTKENVFEYMERIVKGEKLKIDKEALEVLYEISEGDMRKATNVLQASAVMGKKITKDVIYEVAAQAEPKEVIGMMNHAFNGKFTDAREILKELLLKKGISGQDIIKEISNQLYKLDISDNAKIDLVEKVGESEFRINQGGNEQLQLEALLAQFALYKK
jgi:replication factor C small subunit